MEKMTKTQWYEEIINIVNASNYEDKAGAVEFLERQIELINAKAEKAKAKTAEKKAAGDELRAVVENVLTDEFQTISAIVEQIEGEDVTKAKVTARLTQLCKAGIAEKQSVKDGSRSVMAYRILK